MEHVCFSQLLSLGDNLYAARDNAQSSLHTRPCNATKIKIAYSLKMKHKWSRIRILNFSSKNCPTDTKFYLPLDIKLGKKSRGQEWYFEGSWVYKTVMYSYSINKYSDTIRGISCLLGIRSHRLRIRWTAYVLSRLFSSSEEFTVLSNFGL